MLIHLFSEPEKKDFGPIAELLSISDKPLLWDGKSKDEITSNTKLEDLSLRRGEKELELLVEWKVVEPGPHRRATKIERRLLDRLRSSPLQVIEEPATRVNSAREVLRELLHEKKSTLPSFPKLALFHLMLLALADGHISSIEYCVLDELKTQYRLEDYIFQDILERAESTHRETQKTIALILE